MALYFWELVLYHQPKTAQQHKPNVHDVCLKNFDTCIFTEILYRNLIQICGEMFNCLSRDFVLWYKSVLGFGSIFQKQIVC